MTLRNILHRLGSALVSFIVVWGAIALSCRCQKEPEPVIVPEPVPTVIRSAVAPVPPAAPEPVPPTWEPVENLQSIAGTWGDEPGGEVRQGAWTILSSREASRAAGEVWSIPYPWRLELVTEKDEIFDCGLFEALHDTWRVGYCLEDNRRRATRIELYQLPGRSDRVRVKIGEAMEAVLLR